jgi:hypothetical protein
VPREIGALEAARRPQPPHTIKEGEAALVCASNQQRAAHRRLQARAAIRGVVLLSDGTLQVGFETSRGRDREALIAPSGERAATFDTYQHSAAPIQ